MNTKAKIILILKILLILIFVPVGVSSLAGEMLEASLDAKWKRTEDHDTFTGTKGPKVIEQYGEVKSYDEVLNYLSNSNNNQYNILNGQSRVFNLFKGMTVGRGEASDFTEGCTSYTKTTQILDHWMPHQLTSVQQYSCESNNTVWKGKPIFYNIAYAISFFKSCTNHTVENGIVTGDTGNHSTSKCYEHEQAQQAIWKCINGTNESDTGTILWEANQAYVDAEKIKQEHKIKDIELTKGEKIESYLTEDKKYVVVGPFHISDHAYAYHEAYNLENIYVGLDKCEIEVNGETLTNYGDAYYSICYDKQGKIQYKEGQENPEIQNTDYIGDFGFLAIPDSYKKNRVPFPNNEFYIRILKSKLEPGDELTKVTLTAKDIIAEGNGSVLLSRKQETLNRWEPAHNTTGNCNNCGATVIIECSSCSGEKTTPHECGKYKCGIEDETNNSGDFLWKMLAKSTDGNTFYASNEWMMAVLPESKVFKEMLFHLEKSHEELSGIEIEKSNEERREYKNVDELKRLLKDRVKV